MGFWQLLASTIAEKVADKLTDEIVKIMRKGSRINEIGHEATSLKEELANAESAAEREAVLDKIHDLINGFNGV